MNNIITATLAGMFSGVAGTGLGGILGFFINKNSSKLMSFMLQFSAGIMISIVCFDLMPEAFVIGGTWSPTVGMIDGIIAMYVIERILYSEKIKFKYRRNKNIKSGLLLALGIAIHNFPEGVAIGSTFSVNRSLSLGIIVAMALHDIPEGVACVLPLRASGVRPQSALLLTVLSGVPTGVGALAGALLGGISSEIVAISLGFAGGAMLYVVLGEILGRPREEGEGRFATFGGLAGMLAGMLISRGIFH